MVSGPGRRTSARLCPPLHAGRQPTRVSRTITPVQPRQITASTLA
jgi:hypothetical protein